jgi:hypothetical protein
MLRNFRRAESLEYPGEVSIYAEDTSTGGTVFCVVSRDALADVWQTSMLDQSVTRRLVKQQIDKFGRVMSAKYERHPESFEPSPKHPHQLRSVLTTADFHSSGESFSRAEVLDAAEAALLRTPRDI